MSTPPAGRGSDPCPVCGHPEDVHVVWQADATFDGWAHCTVGKGDTACTCWREWPRLSGESDDPTFAEVVPETDDRRSPRDWRYAVHTLGRVLIATGLLLGGFVAYQLWGTGIEARRAQNELEDEFDALLAASSTSTAPTSTAPPSTEPPDTVASDTIASDTVPETVPDTVPPTVPPATVPIADGDPVARLEIPAIDLDVVVVAGVSVDDLRRGPGHYPDTPLPGQFGNAAIAGHRMTYDGPFQNVDDLDPGDEIVVTTVAGRYVYEVTGTEIVEPEDTDVVATTNPDIAELTLTSCHPKWSTDKRIIVHSLLIADQSAPVGYAVGAEPATPTTTTPTATTIAPTATSEPTGTSTPSTTIAPTTATTIASPPSAGPPVTPPSADALTDGWFHDRSAIPQVVLWGLAVTAIAVLAHMLRRLARSRIVGIAVGIVPFLIALYFFYQNVNRLLPPSL